jgi:glycerol kinase
VWRSQRELQAARKIERVFEPRQSRDWREGEYARWREAVARLLMPAARSRGSSARRPPPARARGR